MLLTPADGMDVGRVGPTPEVVALLPAVEVHAYVHAVDAADRGHADVLGVVLVDCLESLTDAEA